MPTNEPAGVERNLNRLGLVLGFVLFVALVGLICVALALGLDEGSWWRDGLGQWLIGLGAVGLVVAAAAAVRRYW